MSTTHLVLLVVYEIISLVIIFRLWTGRKRAGVFERCLLSVMLLVPGVGWFLYLFLRPSPSDHGEDVGDHWGDGGDGGAH
jgi:hypothetical protein